MYFIFRAFALLKVLASSAKVELSVGSVRLLRREGPQQMLARNSVRFAKLPQQNRSRWILSKANVSCETTCGQEGLHRDAKKQSEVTKENITKIVEALGMKCDVIRSVGHCGAPWVRIYSPTETRCLVYDGIYTSQCNTPLPDPDSMKSLCFCRAITAWSIVHATRACEGYFFQHGHQEVGSFSGVDLEGCKARCEEMQACKTLDFFAATQLCMLYNATCDKSQAVSDHDEPSAWKVSQT
eukprot:TRINITY_DN30426_c0_g1_i1.p1 TRINITY_DN30426_c0_g1~~TRINITY_DN30426_c0_g1_i1.p1  ORF type:complete len:240 (+),score=25.89 TRINITY_DN30426_c0_g1_i1:36-755(+)